MAVQRQLYSGLDLYDWEGKGPNGRTKVSDIPKWQQNQEDIRHLPGAFPVQNVVITDGQITPTAAALAVDTEGGAPADDLTAIAPGDLHAGMLLALCSVDAGRKITIKSSAGASGIQTLDGKDVTLDTQYAVMLRLVSTESLTLWREEPGPLRLQLTVSTPDTLGGVKVQTGDNDGLEMIGDKLRVRKANSTQYGGVLASETAQAGATPLGGKNGKLHGSWFEDPPVTLFNTRIVITESNAAWAPPVEGWARITVIGGGGAGGDGADKTIAGRGGGQGGTSSFGTISAVGGSGGGGAGSYDANSPGGGGGGGAGKVTIDYVYLNASTPVKIVIGAGGRPSQTAPSSASGMYYGGDGQGPEGGRGGNARQGGIGAPGASSGGYADSGTGYSGNGGSGAITGYGYGGGGGGGRAISSASTGNTNTEGRGGSAGDGGKAGSSTIVTGGDGGPGAVIIEYYDPEKEGA